MITYKDTTMLDCCNSSCKSISMYTSNFYDKMWYKEFYVAIIVFNTKEWWVDLSPCVQLIWKYSRSFWRVCCRSCLVPVQFILKMSIVFKWDIYIYTHTHIYACCLNLFTYDFNLPWIAILFSVNCLKCIIWSKAQIKMWIERHVEKV